MNQYHKTLRIANIVAFITMVLVNTLAVTLPIAGRDTGEISELYPNLFVPAGYAFSIWSLIYMTLFIFIVLQSKSLFSSEVETPSFVSNIGWWFVISCIANVSWILAWHHLMVPLSVFLMLIILGSLIMIYNRLRTGLVDQESSFFVRLPFSIYLGWITVATVANVTTLLVSMNWSGFGITQVHWTIIMLAVATIVGLLVLWQRKDLCYIAVIVWALVAIMVKRNALDVPSEAGIITMIYLCLTSIVAVVIGRLLLSRQY